MTRNFRFNSKPLDLWFFHSTSSQKWDRLRRFLIFRSRMRSPMTGFSRHLVYYEMCTNTQQKRQKGGSIPPYATDGSSGDEIPGNRQKHDGAAGHHAVVHEFGTARAAWVGIVAHRVLTTSDVCPFARLSRGKVKDTFGYKNN